MGLAPCLCLLLVCFAYVRSDIVLTQSASASKKFGESHKLSCSVSGFNLDSYHIHWIKEVSGKGLEWLLASRKPSETKLYAPGVEGRIIPSKGSSATYIEINDLRIEDTAMYYCARTVTGWAMDFWGQGTMVTVTGATQSPPTLYALLSSCEQPNTGGPVTYGCLAMDYFPEITSLSWSKDNEPITTGLKTYPSVFNKKGTYTLSSQLTITESEVGSSTIYCQVRRSGSDWSVEMPDRVVHHPTVILTLSSSEEIISSRSSTAVCSIIDFRPKSLTVNWLKNGQLMDSGFVTSPICEVNGNFSATSRLTFPAGEWFAGSVYTCQVSHQGATQIQNITRSPDEIRCNDPEITLPQPSLEQVLLEATVTLTCVVSNAPYGVNVSWTREKETLKSEIAVQPGEAPNSVISNLNISTQAWLSGDEFYCVVSHQDITTPIRDSIHKEKAKQPREPSVSVLLPPAEGDSAQRFVSLTCLVRGFSPREIFVKWTVNDKPVNSGNYKNTEVMAENGSSSFFMYSLLSIAAVEWASGASYSCVVGHEANPFKIINRTVNKSSDSSYQFLIEDFEEESGNWTTASTFIFLFFLSMSYSAAVTLVKVK